MGRLTLAGLCLLLTCAARGAAGDPVQPLDGEAIAAIWKDRQDKVTTATFEFTSTEFYPRGGYSYCVPNYRMVDGTISIVPEEPLPESEHRVSSKARWVVDGVRVRYDYFSCQCDRPSRRFWLRRELTAFDGSYYRTISADADGREAGAIQKAVAFPDSMLVGVSPLFNALRGRTKGLARITPQELSPTGRRASIDKVECLEYLVRRAADGSVHRHVWLAPSQGWQVFREVIHAVKSDVLDKKDVRYKPDPVAGWVPVTWEYSRTVASELKVHNHCAVNSHVINAEIPSTEFVLSFPRGMRVMDEDARGGGLVGTVQPDGQLSPDDGRPAYPLPGATSSRGGRALKVGLYALIGGTGTLLARRLVRRRSVPVRSIPS